MGIFYQKTLNCGCSIIALTASKENDTFILGGHNYSHICNECKQNMSEDVIDDRLEEMYKNDCKISMNCLNGWISLYKK